MQSNVVKNFRQRLVLSGFTNISIYMTNYIDKVYNVRCMSAEGDYYNLYMTEVDMAGEPKKVWFSRFNKAD